MKLWSIILFYTLLIATSKLFIKRCQIIKSITFDYRKAITLIPFYINTKEIYIHHYLFGTSKVKLNLNRS